MVKPEQMLKAPGASAINLQSHLLTTVIVARQAMKNRALLMWEAQGLPEPLNVQRVGSHEWQPFALEGCLEGCVEVRDVPLPPDKRGDLSIIQFNIIKPMIFPLHRHNQRTVLFCNRGELELVVEGVRIDMKNGHLYDVEPRHLQMWIVDQPCQITVTFIPGLPWEEDD